MTRFSQNKHQAFLRYVFMCAVIVYSFICTPPIWSERLTYFSTEHGLSHPLVNTIFQDSEGIIWIGTEAEVHWYLGNQFQTLSDQQTKISGKLINVKGIAEDTSGGIWFFNKFSGVYRLDKSTWKLNSVSVTKHPSVSDSSELEGHKLFISPTQQVIIATNQGIFSYSGNSKQLERIEVIGLAQDLTLHVSAISMFSETQIGIGTNQGLFIYDENAQSFKPFLRQMLGNKSVSKLVIDGDYTWVLSYSGILKLHRRGQFVSHVHELDFPTNRLHGFLLEQDGSYWLSMIDGIKHFSNDHKLLRHFKHEHTNLGSLSSNTIGIAKHADRLWFTLPGALAEYSYSTNKLTYHSIDVALQRIGQITATAQENIVKDLSGNFWIGTSYGLAKMANQPSRFEHYLYDVKTQSGDPGQPRGPKSNLSRAVLLDSKNRLWFGSQDIGLSRLDRSTRQWHYFQHDPADEHSLGHNHVRAIVEDSEGIIWAGTEGGGLNRYDERKKHWIRYTQGGNKDHIFGLLADQTNQIWVTHGEGLSLFSKDSLEFDYFSPVAEEIAPPMLRGIIRSKSGHLWLTAHPPQYSLNKQLTNSGGLYKFNTDSYEWLHVEENLSSDHLFGMTEDLNGNLWIGTWGDGIEILHADQQDVTQMTIEHGLPSDVIYNLYTTRHNDIWFSSANGLGQIIPCGAEHLDKICEAKIRLYNDQNDLMITGFDSESGYQHPSGELLFGGDGGFISVDTNLNIPTNLVPPSDTFITHYEVQDQRLYTVENNHTSVWVAYAEYLTIKEQDLPVSLFVANNDYTQPTKNQFQYRLNGGKWLDVTYPEKRITFNHLNHGQYYLEVRSSNNDGIWTTTPQSIRLEVVPPWFQSSPAFFTYFLIIALLIWQLLLFRHRLAKQTEQELKTKVEQRTNELTSANQLLQKVLEQRQQFFENVSHELKTPLTLIFNAIETIKGNNDDKATLNTLETINHSSVRLHHLIEQLLSIADNDEQNTKKVIVNTEATTQKVVNDLQMLAGKHQNTLSVQTSTHVELILKEEVYETILINLLTNAIKYSYENSPITVLGQPEEDAFVIRVINKGEPLSEKDISRMFDKHIRLSQHKAIPGEGLGLAVIKQHIDELGGDIHVSSSARNEIEVRVSIPDKYIFNYGEYIGHKPVQAIENKGAEFQALVVDDNPEIVNYLSTLMSAKFSVYTATNGLEAINILKQQSFDILLSDVMMPELNGYELCQHVREMDNDNSSIPIILITAKHDHDSIKKGLTAGATDYITKPFNSDLLKLTISNYIKTFKQFRQRIAEKSLLVTADKVTLSDRDKAFKEQLEKVLKDNFHDHSFNVSRLAVSLAMDVRTLRRKTEKLLHQTPNNILKHYRLECAKNLLSGNASISEVAYSCGFASFSHFSKSFKDKYSVTPKIFQQQQSG